MENTLHPEALNLRHLRAWLTIVDERGITAGARKLGVSQPALSQQLRALEDFFGCELIERLPRGVQVTPSGRALLNDAREAVAAASRLIRQAQIAAGLESGVIEIATLPTLVEAILLDPIRRWQSAHKNVAIRIQEFAAQPTMVDAVSIGFGDLAIGVTPPEWPGSVIELGWEHFVAVLPTGDPLLRRRGPIRLQELSKHNWILYDAANGLSDYVLMACAVAGFRPKSGVLTSQVHIAVNLAASGLGVALVPSMNVPRALRPNQKTLREPIAWQLAAFTRRDYSASAIEFVKLLQDRTWPSRPKNAFVLPGN